MDYFFLSMPVGDVIKVVAFQASQYSHPFLETERFSVEPRGFATSVFEMCEDFRATHPDAFVWEPSQAHIQRGAHLVCF